jgi:fumarate reductase subunit D
MEPTKGTPSKTGPRLTNFGGKNLRYYASALTMLLLILIPFGLYAALNHGNTILAGILFTIIAVCMLVMLIVA